MSNEEKSTKRIGFKRKATFSFLARTVKTENDVLENGKKIFNYIINIL
jgi:hypothetical protein